jgi:hypothetical protein
LLVVQRNILINALAVNSRFYTPEQKAAVQEISSMLYMTYDEYVQNANNLITAINQYTRIRVQILTEKNQACNCPTEMLAKGIATFAIIDKNVQTIIDSVANEGRSIRWLVRSLTGNISSVIDRFKSNPKHSALVTAFNDVLTVVKGFSSISTKMTVNATKTCDDAAAKIVFIQYYTEFYFQMNLEAHKNSSLGSYTLSVLNSNIATTSLTAAQKAELKIFVTFQTQLSDIFRRFISATVASQSKLPVQLNSAKTARSLHCNCNQPNAKGRFQLQSKNFVIITSNRNTKECLYPEITSPC